MRVWISFLLIGSITCGPVGKKNEANSADMSFMRQPSSGYWFSGEGPSSNLGSSAPLPSLPYPSSAKATEQLAPQDALSSTGPGSYASFGDERYNSPEVSEYGAAYAAYSPSTGYDSSYGGGYGSSASYVGDSSYGYAADPQAESWSSGSANGYGASGQNPEPVFSDVSDLEPVYSFNSRSSYQRGRAVFAQTRYSPGYPAPLMPASRSTSKTSKQSSPAKAPTKGGF